MKTHLAVGGCSRGMAGWQVTTVIADVTCKTCKDIIWKYELWERKQFGDCPTLPAIRIGVGYGKNRQIGLLCPICRSRLIHGGGEKFGDGDGHRSPHCNCWKSGYTIKEVEPSKFLFPLHGFRARRGEW